MTISEVEALLDAGRLELFISYGKHWRLRRNGATRRWKRDPARFEIPCKVGFRGHFTIESTDLGEQGIRIV